MKMTKLITRIAVLAAGVMASSSVMAQNRVFYNPSNHAYWGARVALDVTVPGDFSNGAIKVDAYNPGAGFSLGIVRNMPIVANMYLEPGLELFYNTMGSDDIQLGTDDVLGNQTGKFKVKEWGLRVPVRIGYHLDFDAFSLKLFTGPMFRWGLHGRETFSTKQGNATISESEDFYKDGTKSFDFKWEIGGGIVINQFEIDLSGAVGLRNQVDEKGLSWHRNLFQLTLGYNF